MMNDFQYILSQVNTESFSDIEGHWQSMKLGQCITPELSLDKKINGLYALKHAKYGIIYIGKGKPIFNRIKSHYYATKGKEKAPAWKQFFEYMTDDMTVYWYEVNHLDEVVGEQAREVLERLLQIKYKPLFEIIYKNGIRKELPDINGAVNEFLAKRDT
jgi:hypothetical protein